MGELRSAHFHAGLDIHAGVGTSVYAANDGYIYRVPVATGGYGTVLYLRPSRRQCNRVCTPERARRTSCRLRSAGADTGEKAIRR